MHCQHESCFCAVKSKNVRDQYNPVRAHRAMSAPSGGRTKERRVKVAKPNAGTTATNDDNDAVQSVVTANIRPISALPVIRENVRTVATPRVKLRRPQSSTPASTSRVSSRRQHPGTGSPPRLNSARRIYSSPSSQRGDPQRMPRSTFIRTATANESPTRQPSDCVAVPHFVQLETLVAGQVFVSTATPVHNGHLYITVNFKVYQWRPDSDYPLFN